MNLINLKSFGIVLILFVCCNTIIAQPKLKLKQKKSSKDIVLVNGEYKMYIAKKDIKKGIALIEIVLNVNCQSTLKKIKSFKSIDLNNIKPEDEGFVKILKSNLGVLLFSKKQIAVTHNGQILKQIDTEEAPPKQSLEGVITRTVYYLLDRGQKPFFIGKANKEVVGYR